MPWATALWLSGIGLLAHLLVAARTELSFDETYYALWSRHLAWSYPDHPPAVAALIAAARWLLGERALAVRAPALLAGVLVPWVLAGAVAHTRGRVAARRLLWLLYATPLLHVLGVVTTPDTPLALAWALGLALLLLCLGDRPEGRGEGPAPWGLRLALGVVLGLAILSKLTGWALAAGVVAASVRHAGLRRRLGGWRGLGWMTLVALAVSAGWIAAAWQAPAATSLGFQLSRLRPRGHLGAGLLGYVAGQAGVVSPGIALLALGYAVGAASARSAASDLEPLLLWLSLPLLLVFALVALLRPVEANWVGPGWLPLLIGVALRPPGARALRGSLALGVAMVVLLHGLVLTAPLTPLSRHGGLARLFGWRALTAEVRRACRPLPLLVRDYGVAAEMAWRLGEARVAPRIAGRRSAFEDWPAVAFVRATGACALDRCERSPPEQGGCRWQALERPPEAGQPALCLWRLTCEGGGGPFPNRDR